MASNNAMTTAPPVTQATMLKRTHEIQCGKCAISDYAENIGVWNDDGTLQELGLCGECEEKYPICEICADECVDYDDKLCHGCYHKSVGADECWCACAVDECLTDRARDTLKRFAEKKDIVGCCEKCDMEIVRDSDEHDNCLIGADDKFYCQHCPAAMCEMCESCYTNGGSISVLGRDISICENCDMGGDCYDGFLDEYHYNAETNDYEEKKEIVGKCEQCECDVTTDQEYLKLKTGPGAGRIYCEEHVGWGECQKAWSGSCGCDVCADEEEEEQKCDGCGTTCLDHTSNKGRGSESPCEECDETRCKLCPCECEEAVFVCSILL